MNNWKSLIRKKSISELLERYPMTYNFLENYNLLNLNKLLTLKEGLQGLAEDRLEEFGLDMDSTENLLCDFLESFYQQKEEQFENQLLQSLTIIGGRNKSGINENVEISIHSGEVISIVGPTGSGKSRLLGDIECLAQRDTPTKRQILINGKVPTQDERFELNGKIVAQLSQNMNFVMDLSVKEFLYMHANSRMTEHTDDTVQKCFICANELAGEKFTMDTKVTQLSGGQSRSLMIADTAFMSSSPIVLIDEIENAGIDRRHAVELLAKKDKIVLISTHDPFLALNADKRIVIKNGGIADVILTGELEKTSLSAIETLDGILLDLRNQLRNGKRINFTGVTIGRG